MKKVFKMLTAGIIMTGFFVSCNNNANNHHEDEHSGHHHHQHDDSPARELEVNAENSLYQLESVWTNQDNQATELKDFQGKIQLVSMIFTHCGYACPMTVENMKTIESQLPKKLRDKVQFVLITMDDERDTPDVLKKYADLKELTSNWTLLHGDAEQIRALSMVLNVQYNKLEDGDYNHNNILTILDKEGNMTKQWEGLELDNKTIANVVKELIEG